MLVFVHVYSVHALESVKLSEPACLGTEEAAEDDGCSSSARRDNIDDESNNDSNDSDSGSSSSGEDVNASLHPEKPDLRMPSPEFFS